MKAAIIYDDGKIYVEFKPEKFAELFKRYFEKTKDIDRALELIIVDLKKLTIKK